MIPLKQDTTDSASPPLDHAFLGRKAWNERYGGEVQQKEFFAKLAVISVGTACIAVAGMLYAFHLREAVPVRTLVVEVDTLTGRVVQQPALNEGEARDVRIKAGLARYVEDLRSVYFDYAVMDKAFRRVQAQSSSKTTAVLEKRMKLGVPGAPENPVEIAKSRQVTAEVDLVQPRGSEDTWTVRWTEVTRGTSGEEISRKRYEGVFTVGFREVTNLEQFKANENGLMVLGLDWQEITKI